MPPNAWSVPPRPQPWYPQPPAVSIPPPAPLGYAQQPLFPVQNVRPPVPSSAPPALQPTHIAPPGLPTSAPPAPTSQPLFPVGVNNNITAQNPPFSAPVVSTSIPPGLIVDTKAPLDAQSGKTFLISSYCTSHFPDMTRLSFNCAKLINSIFACYCIYSRFWKIVKVSVLEIIINSKWELVKRVRNLVLLHKMDPFRLGPIS